MGAVPLPRTVAAPVAAKVPIDTAREGSRLARRVGLGLERLIAEAPVAPPVPLGLRRGIGRPSTTAPCYHRRFGSPMRTS